MEPYWCNQGSGIRRPRGAAAVYSTPGSHHKIVSQVAPCYLSTPTQKAGDGLGTRSYPAVDIPEGKGDALQTK